MLTIENINLNPELKKNIILMYQTSSLPIGYISHITNMEQMLIIEYLKLWGIKTRIRTNIKIDIINKPTKKMKLYKDTIKKIIAKESIKNFSFMDFHEKHNGCIQSIAADMQIKIKKVEKLAKVHGVEVYHRSEKIEDKQKIIDLFNEGNNVSEIVRETGYTYYLIRNLLLENGINIKESKTKNADLLTKELLIDLYETKKLSTKEIASLILKEYDHKLSFATVRLYLMKFNIPLRTSGNRRSPIQTNT